MSQSHERVNEALGERSLPAPSAQVQQRSLTLDWRTDGQEEDQRMSPQVSSAINVKLKVHLISLGVKGNSLGNSLYWLSNLRYRF